MRGLSVYKIHCQYARRHLSHLSVLTQVLARVFFHQDIFTVEYCHRPCSYHPLTPHQNMHTYQSIYWVLVSKSCFCCCYWDKGGFISYARVYVTGNTRSEKGVLDLLKLELHMVGRHYMDTNIVCARNS